MLRLVLALPAMAVISQAQRPELIETELTIQQAIDAGQLADALDRITTALKRHPDEAGLLNLRGIVRARQDHMGDARTDFAEAVRVEPGLTPAWQNLARACQIEAEQAGSASSCGMEAWQHVLLLKPNDMEARSSLALLYEKQGRYADSLREIEHLAGDRAASTAMLALRCADFSGLHRLPEAKTAAAQVAQRADFSNVDFASMQSGLRSPQAAAVMVILAEALDTRGVASPSDLQRLAIAYEQLERPADARKTLERIAITDPNNPAHLLELARLAEDSRDHEGALGYLGHARELAPNNARIHFLFGIIAAEMDLPVEARRSLERALAIDPANADYSFAMGSVILSTRDAATAANYFQRYVQAKPADPKGHYALGVAYFASGDYEKTKQQMHYVGNNLKGAGGAEYFLGRIARMQGDLEEASRRLRKSIDLMPSFSESHTEWARVLLEQGKLEQARTQLDRALALDPKSFQGNAQLLVLYRRTRDPRAAKQAEILKQLDEDRSKRAELMLRTIEVRP